VSGSGGPPTGRSFASRLDAIERRSLRVSPPSPVPSNGMMSSVSPTPSVASSSLVKVGTRKRRILSQI
jgi:hypothetical protein